MPPEVMTAAEAAARIPDGATIALTGSGGGVLEPHALIAAVEDRFLDSGGPRGLTVVHAFGLGDRENRGLNALAHEGLVKRVVGGHWTWAPKMIELAAAGRIEAYSWPAGAISLMMREVGARRPGLVTRTGLHTFADPRLGGGRFNAAAEEELISLVRLDGEEFLHYRPMRVDVALIRGTEADPRGNIGCGEEAAVLDALALAQAARAGGGLVVAQVKRLRGEPLDPRDVVIPAALVDVVVPAPDQWQTYASEYDPALCGPAGGEVTPALADPVRAAVARRAALEVPDGAVLNVGFGMSAQVVDVLAEQGRLPGVTLAIEQGLFDGVPETGNLFGVARGASARVASTTQFDLFSGGLLDVCCLGMAQLDETGSVNVSRFGSQIIGPGGFVDISQNARKAVFCGTFTAKNGAVRKLVPKVDEVTYSGPFALAEGREAVYVTERAVFRLTPAGVELIEIAEGLTIERDILPFMGFRPIIHDVRPMR
ncbi:CoA-transferase [Planotetraspora sp. GP83]|uniref:CoA-transferase n=1 Tax=Planotetraspora sp. GP83 TaxID=3156264 RepID=UPI003511D5D6